MHTYLPLVVLRCCLDEFQVEFLTFVVLGILVGRFVNNRRRDLRLGGVLLVLYAVCEGIATGVCHGHLNGILAVLLGLLSLGMALGLGLFAGFDVLRKRGKNRQ